MEHYYISFLDKEIIILVHTFTCVEISSSSIVYSIVIENYKYNYTTNVSELVCFYQNVTT